jgi:hypothetical protein
MLKMNTTLYQKLKDTAMAMAKTLPTPAFYGKHAQALKDAEETLKADELVRKCRAYLNKSQLECAHGVGHCETVARDAGALVLIETAKKGIIREDTDHLFIAAEIAGLLHDIKRKEKDHALLGSIEAGKMLTSIGMDKRYRTYITDAIKNHEAFKEVHDPKDAAGRLVSDALYDADKFRWGPENFTTTLWLMVEAQKTPPETLYETFREKMKGVERIRETFRTGTGKRYGPEFIDQGVRIGNVVYNELAALIKKHDDRD